MELTLFRSLNGFAGHGAFPDGVILFLANNLQFVLVALLIVLASFPPRRLRMGAAALVAAILSRGVVKPLIALFVQRPRPFVTHDGVHNLIGSFPTENFMSFPSGHALFLFALAMAVYRFDRFWGRVFFTGACIIGVARVVAGVHWPSDVLCGALIGMLVGWYTVQWIRPFRLALPRT